ncbi:MAG: hypothetical protein E4H36_02715 [Spirochaetales bacterium]|nr:MAG: hypothetical protein E4H36_02715 [Spirochaetales bacterium]
MNQDRIKELLLKLAPAVPEFSLILSGKKSRKVNGLYKPDTREIVIHNKNMNDDHAIMYTAIHEFAHHIHFTGEGRPSSSRSHTSTFWSIFHNLLASAEASGIYINPLTGDKEFENLTRRIRDDFLVPNSSLMKELGGLLYEAMELCRKKRYSFEDYLDRILGIHRNLGKTLMKFHQYDIDSKIGYENMKVVASLASPELRKTAEGSFLSGNSPDMVRTELRSYPKGQSGDSSPGGGLPKPLSELELLEMEKQKVEKTLKTLETKLDGINKRIKKLSENRPRGLVIGE